MRPDRRAWLTLLEAAMFTGLDEDRLLGLALTGAIDGRMALGIEYVRREHCMWLMTSIEASPNGLVYTTRGGTS